MSGINLQGTINTGLPSTVGINGFQTGPMGTAVQENPWSPYFGEPIKGVFLSMCLSSLTLLLLQSSS
jgi:hypothetical protein